MALISDPRLFIYPLFHVKRDGTFVAEHHEIKRLQPEEIFSCRKILDYRKPVPLLPARGDSEIIPVICEGEITPLFFLSTFDKYTPLFWRAEFFSESGRECTESQYDSLWEHKRSNEIVYIAFDTSKRPLSMQAYGRLFYIVLYSILFEAEEELDQVIEIIQQQKLKRVLSQNWEVLTLPTRVDMGAGKVTFRTQLSAKFVSVAEIMRLLYPESTR